MSSCCLFFKAGLVYSCDGLPSAAVGTLLAQLLASSATRSPLQFQGRAAGRGARAGCGGSSSISGEYEGPISRECCWAWPDLPNAGLLGGLLTPPHLHRSRQPAANRPVVQTSSRLQGPASALSAPVPRVDAAPVAQALQIRTGDISENEKSEATELSSQNTEAEAGPTNRITGNSLKLESGKVGDPSALVSCPPQASAEGSSHMIVELPNATAPEAALTSSSKVRPGEKSSESRTGKPSRPVKLPAGVYLHGGGWWWWGVWTLLSATVIQVYIYSCCDVFWQLHYMRLALPLKFGLTMGSGRLRL